MSQTTENPTNAPPPAQSPTEVAPPEGTPVAAAGTPPAAAEIPPAAVSTTPATEAVSTNAQNIIVANHNGKYLRFAKAGHVPTGCRTYTTKSELKGQTKKQLESIYAYVKGVDPKTFKDHDAAVENVWNAFGQLPVFDPAAQVAQNASLPDEPKRGAKKTAEPGTAGAAAPAVEGEKGGKYVKKREESSKYVILPRTDKSDTSLAELAPQAKSIVDIIRKDGKPEYTEDELKALMEANKEIIRTKQAAWRIFQYYRSSLISSDFLVQR